MRQMMFSVYFLAAVLGVVQAVTLIVNENPRHPSSLYRGPPTYGGIQSVGHRRSSAPYIMVSRLKRPDCEHEHRWMDQRRPTGSLFMSPAMVETGRQFSYKKRPVKPKLFTAVKSPPVTSNYRQMPDQGLNYEPKEFKGKWEIIKPPETEDGNIERIVTYNSDGTRVLPEPIYNYHTRQLQLLWSPMQKLHRFDGHEQRSQNGVGTEASNDLTEMTSVSPSTSTTTTQVSSKVTLTVLPAYYDVRSTENTFNSDVDNASIAFPEQNDIRAESKSNDNRTNNELVEPTFFSKFGENAKNVFSHIFGNFGLNAVPDTTEKTLNDSNATLQKLHENEKLEQNETLVEMKNKTSEIRYSDEVDPTSISGWRPMIKKQVTIIDDEISTTPAAITEDHRQLNQSENATNENLEVDENEVTKEADDYTNGPVSWLFGANNWTLPTDDEDEVEASTNRSLIDIIDSLSSYDNETSNTTGELAYKGVEPSNVSVIVIPDNGSWLQAPNEIETTNDVEIITREATIDVEPTTTTTMSSQHATNQIKNVYKRVKFGIPFPFEILQSLAAYL